MRKHAEKRVELVPVVPVGNPVRIHSGRIGGNKSMNTAREEICRKCKMLPSIKHLDYPSCIQPVGPINDEERKMVGPDITAESFRKMMEISIQPYCLRKMLTAHPIEWWMRQYVGPD